jgi:hypothetical protein
VATPQIDFGDLPELIGPSKRQRKSAMTKRLCPFVPDAANLRFSQARSRTLGATALLQKSR